MSGKRVVCIFFRVMITIIIIILLLKKKHTHTFPRMNLYRPVRNHTSERVIKAAENIIILYVSLHYQRVIMPVRAYARIHSINIVYRVYAIFEELCKHQTDSV